MVLKRLFLAALGALGLGVLAAGPAVAQQIPAPDSFNNSSACAAKVPKAPKAPEDHPLKDSIDGDALTDMDRAALSMEGRPCDVNGDEVGFGDPVADGIDKARDLHDAVATAFSRLETARKAYQADDSAGNKTALDNAEKTHDEAVMKRDAYAGDGAVYGAVFTEQMRKSEASTAATNWETAVTEFAESQEKVDNVVYGEFIDKFAGFDSDGAAYEFVLLKVADTDPDTDGDQPGTFIQVKGADGKIIKPGDDAPTTVTTFDHDDAFDSGTDVALSSQNHDGDDDTPGILAVTASADVLSATRRFGNDGAGDDDLGIDDISKAAKKAYDDAKKAAENNKDLTQQTALDEAARKAKARHEFFDAQRAKAYRQLQAGNLKRFIGDNPDTDATETDYMKDFTTADYRAYSSAKSDRDAKAELLEGAYDALAAANRAVENALKDAGDYLGQLVELREYEKAVADQEAEDADAEEETAAQKAANKALGIAQGQLDSYNEFQGLDEDNPVKQLVNSLLVADGDDDDDDGQALVDAIKSTYGTANDAATKAQETADMVEGLTGEGGQVNQNSMKIQENTDSITELDGRVAANEAEIGMDENGMSRIDHNEARSMANAGNIMMNAENIATNAGNIAMNTSEIMRVEGRVDTNWDAIAANQTAIGMNSSAIEANTASIGMNADAIATNMNSIGENRSSIMRNADMIGGLQDQMEIVRAGVAASMALAGMPAINGRGISIGVGSFDGESAFAVGFMIQGEMASFKVGVTSAGGETGASAGVGFQF